MHFPRPAKARGFFLPDCKGDGKRRGKFLAFLQKPCYTLGMERIIAFDIGDRRVGVASSDPFGEYAMPSDTYFRTGNPAEDAEALAAIAREKGATLIVCGLPLEESGEEGVQAAKTRKFAAKIQEAAKIPICFSDERYTTRAARSDLHALGISAKKDKKKKNVDSLAAAYILENYLSDRRHKMSDMKEEGNDYEDDSIVELVDDEGTTYRYEHLMTFEYKGEWYVALTPALEAEEGEEDEGEDVAIFHVTGSEEDEHLETVDDDALLDELFEEFTRRYDEDDEEDDGE